MSKLEVTEGNAGMDHPSLGKARTMTPLHGRVVEQNVDSGSLEICMPGHQ